MVGSVLLLGYPYTITERRFVQHLKGGSNIMSKTNGLNSLSKYALRDTSKNVMMLALGCTHILILVHVLVSDTYPIYSWEEDDVVM